MSIIDDTLNQLGRPGHSTNAGSAPEALPPQVLFNDQAKRSGKFPRSLLFGFVLVGASVASWLVLEANAPSALQLPTAVPPVGVAPPATPASLPLGLPSGSGAPAEVTEAVRQDVAPVSVASVEPAPEPPVATMEAPRPKRLPASLIEGRELMGAGQKEAALAAWKTGLQALNPRQRLELLMSFKDAEGAFASAGRLEDLDGVFVVEHERQGQKLWRVGLLSSPQHRAEDLEIAASRLGRSDFTTSTPARLLKWASQPVASPKEPVVAKVDMVRPPNAPKALPSLPAGETSFDLLAGQLMEALQQHRYKEATLLASDFRAHFPSRVEVWLWSGKAELGAGNFAGADTHLMRATELAPHLAEAWLLRGIAAQEQGQDQKALAFLAEAKRLKPRDPDTLFNIAYSSARLGDTGRARESFLAFLEASARESRFDAQRRHAEQWLSQGH